MKIQLLGTGAAEGIPAFYSNTRVSQIAREVGGRECRLRSCALLDDQVQIDLGPDAIANLHRYNIDARDWIALIYTHSDDDHFLPGEIQYGLYPFNDEEFLNFPIYGNREICEQIRLRYPSWPIETIETHSFSAYQLAEYTITPVHANHKRTEDAQNLIVEDGYSCLLYATDTGYWEEETWACLQQFKFDIAVIECTEGFSRTDFHGHMDITDCVSTVTRLRDMGCLGEQSSVCTTHHSHMGNATYDELSVALAPHNILAGYDGIILES